MTLFLSGATLVEGRPRIRDYGGRSSWLLALTATVLLLTSSSLNAQDQPSLAVAPNLAAAAEKAFVPAKPLNLNQVKLAIGYPAKAVQANLDGVVVAHILVDATGRVLQYSLEGKAHLMLKEAVAAQIFQLQFEPATRGANRTQSWVKLDFKFALR